MTDLLTARFRSLLPSLPEAGARVVRVVLSDPAAATRSTIGELARQAGTSEGTVTRTVRTLGFTGYSDFRLTLAESARPAPAAAMVTGDVQPDDSLPELIEKVAALEQRSIRETAAQLDATALAGVVDAIADADRVCLYGGAASGLAAADLYVKLTRIGIRASVNSDPHLALAEAALLETGSVALAVSHSGENTDAAEFLRVAAEAGATTVVVSGSSRATIAEEATYALTLAGDEDGPFRSGRLNSRIGETWVAHCLFVAVTQRTLKRSADALERTYDALSPRVRRRGRASPAG